MEGRKAEKTCKGCNMNTLKKQAGVTLSELMTALSIIAILLTLSAPSYSEFINKRTLAGATDLIGSYFENVKMESVKRNSWVTITYKEANGGADWCFGATMDQHVKCDCMASAETTDCRLDANEEPMVLTSTSYKGFDDLQITGDLSNNDHFDINPIRGTISHSEKVNIQLKHSREDYLVNVSLTPTGRVTKCSPSDSKLVGFPTCI